MFPLTGNESANLRFLSFRAINEAELERLCEEREIMTRKLAGLESELKIQQQVRRIFFVFEYF